MCSLDSTASISTDEKNLNEAWGGHGFVNLKEGVLHSRDLKVLIRWGRRDDIDILENGDISMNYNRPTALFLHGAGQSSLSWTTTVRSIVDLENDRKGKKQMPANGEKVNLLAFDARGHGLSESTSDYSVHMDRDSLVCDCIALLTALHSNTAKPMRLFLIGHSMGGAIAVWVANALLKDYALDLKLMGIFVLSPSMTSLVQVQY